MPKHPDIPWLVDNIDVSRWYYRDAPPIGSTIAYMNETYIDHVTRVTPLTIELASGRAMLRPYLGSRLAVWLITAATQPRPRYARGSSKSHTPSTQRLRPDMTVLPA